MALGIAATLAGCGSAPSPLEDPAAPASGAPAQAPQEYPAPDSPAFPAPSPSTSLPPAEREPHIEDALAELNRAEAAVNQLLAPEPDPASTPGVSPEPRPRRPARDAEKAPDTPPAIAASDRCAVACRALASMQSAARHLCSLAGETDARCHNARARVESAQTRVSAGCPSCQEAQ